VKAREARGPKKTQEMHAFLHYLKLTKHIDLCVQFRCVQLSANTLASISEQLDDSKYASIAKPNQQTAQWLLQENRHGKKNRILSELQNDDDAGLKDDSIHALTKSSKDRNRFGSDLNDNDLEILTIEIIKNKDLLEDYRKRKLDWKLKLVTESPLSYVRRQADLVNEILFCVEIPWGLLNLWKTIVEHTSCENANIYNYGDLVNATVVDQWCKIKRDNQRINELLRKQCSYVSSVHKKAKGRKKNNLLNDNVYKLSVKRGEVVEVKSNQELDSKLQFVNEEFENFKRNYNDLDKAKTKLYEEMSSEIIKLKEVQELTEVNKNLIDYIDTLEKNNSMKCQGKKFHEVGKKQQSRKLRFLKNKTQCALWFCESFGLKLTSIKLQDEEELPRSYLIKQLRSNLNKTYHIERTSGPCPGAMINVTTTIKDHVEVPLAKKPELKGQTIKVKISGDGARMTRSTNFMMFSLALLQDDNVMSSKSNRTIAIINGKEDYETIAASLPTFFQEVNGLIESGTMLIDDTEVNLEFFLGGDLKFLVMIMGINSATANYSCLWCNIHKNNRWDTSKCFNFYHQNKQKRTLEDIEKLCSKKSDNYGCINPPLIKIDLDHVNVIDEILERDAILDFNKPKGQAKGVLLNEFVKDINELGVTFNTWYKKNADGTASNILEYTSCVGAQKKLLLSELPNILPKYLFPDTADVVTSIWSEFKNCYDLITDSLLTHTSCYDVFHKAKKWIELFCSLRQKRVGYRRDNVTPYMHIMCYHVPVFIEKYGSIKQFTGQGVEKNNDDAKRMVFQKSNKWDSVKDVLCTESRQWDLKNCQRQKNCYTKRNLEYWDETIKRQRKERRQLSKPIVITADVNATVDAETCSRADYSNFTVSQLRQKVREMGLNRQGLAKMKKNELINLLQC
ncbi:Hypothetical predicted protein, partial [Paramuricea clavata]